jgi:hypothetical protein
MKFSDAFGAKFRAAGPPADFDRYASTGVDGGKSAFVGYVVARKDRLSAPERALGEKRLDHGGLVISVDPDLANHFSVDQM